MQWTALDLKNMAALFDDLADAVLNFRIAMGSTLTPEEKQHWTMQFGLLQSYGEQFENAAVKTALLEVEGSVTDLQSAAHDAARALKVISDVQKAAAIAAAAVGVGFAVFNPTPNSIVGSLNTLVQCTAQALAKPSPGDAGGKSPA